MYLGGLFPSGTCFAVFLSFYLNMAVWIFDLLTNYTFYHNVFGPVSFC